VWNYFQAMEENMRPGHTSRLAYVKLHQNSARYAGASRQLSEKGCIQLQGKFFFAHMNCLDCKKLLSCLAVLWKGLVLQFTVRLTIKDIGLIGVNKTWQGAMVV
jgi:hypothetical protein